MKTKTHSLSPAGVLVGLLCSLPLTASALEYDLSVGHETMRSNNIGRTPDAEVKDWVHIPRASLDASHDTATLALDDRYRFERRIYTEDLFQDRNRLTGSASLTWDALPDRLQFNVSNHRTEATINTLQQDIENNRQLVGYFIFTVQLL